jgi:hypothetical protein
MQPGFSRARILPSSDVKISIRIHHLRKKLYSKALADTENTRNYYDKGVTVTGVDLDFHGIRFNAIERGGTDPG